MSTNPPISTPPPPSTAPRAQDEVEIKIVSHSNLFYWWPVWAVGFLLGILTWVDGYVMAIVPSGSKADRTINVEVEKGRLDLREGVLVPPHEEKKEKHLFPDQRVNGNLPEPEQPHLHVAHKSTYGVVFALTLLLVIVITNVPLRGMWSFMVIVLVILFITVFALFHWWDAIFHAISLLDIRINSGGYFFISTVLLIVWLITFVLFDRQLYMIFTPGQLKVRLEIGGGEKAFDTQGMTIEKQRSDLFRHWILGLGSGDLIVNTSGAHVQHFDLPNVLFIGKKVQQIEDMLREKAVVKGRA
jgi:hypothetical protein